MGVTMASAWRRLCGTAPWVGVAGLAALLPVLLVLLGRNYFLDPNSFNSDDLYCTALCEDVLHGRDLQGWHLPGAPYTFPDVPLLLPCHALFPDIAEAFIAYALLFHLLLLAVLAWVVRQAGLPWRSALGAATAGVVFLVAAHLRPPCSGRGMLLFRPGNHTGCFLIGLLLAGCVLRCLRHGFRWPAVCTVLGTGALGGFSDRLMLVQFVAPLLFALAVLGVMRLAPARRVVPAAGLLVVTCVLAFLTRVLFTRLGFVLLRGENDIHLFAWFDPVQFFHRVVDCMRDQAITRAVLAFHLAAGLLLALAWLRRSRKPDTAGPDGPAVLFVVLVLWASPVCNLAALVCTGMTENPAIDRYLHACFVLPFLTAGLWLSLAPWRGVRAAAALGRIGIALFAIFLCHLLLPRVARQDFAARYPPIARALDDMYRSHGRLRGISGFWPARELSFLTRERIHLRSVNDIGAAYPHASSLQGYLSEDPHDTSVPDYHFIVFLPDGDRMMPSPGAMLCEYGEPLERTGVGPYEVWRYRRLEGRRWELFLRAQLALRLRREWAYVTPAEPKNLQEPRANLTRANRGCHAVVFPDRPLEVRFDRPVTGKLLDVSANFSDQFRLSFFRGQTLVATAHVPAVWWPGNTYDAPGMQARLVPLPDACHREAWDRVVVAAAGGATCCNVGHFLVYQQELPYRFRHGLEPGQQRRYEGENLLPFGQSLVRAAADPAASSGRLGRADAGGVQVLTYGPYAFLPPGRYRVDFTLAVDDAGPGPVASLAIVADGGRTPVRKRELEGTDFPAAGRFTCHGFTLDVAEDLDGVEFRVESRGRTGVSLDCIDLTRLAPDPATPRPGEPENPYSRSPFENRGGAEPRPPMQE
jgi:hypothetical protein